MSINTIKNNFTEAQDILKKFIASKDSWISIEKAGNLLLASFSKENKVIACGNGGSMCDAMHFAEELSGRFRHNRKPFPALCISDPGYISCVGNDFGYAYIFSRFIEAHGQKGDVLMAISTSGNSENVINAMKAAKDKGMKIIALTGKDGGKMASLCDIEIRAPHSEFADRAQEIHIKVIHGLIHFIELEINKKKAQ